VRAIARGVGRSASTVCREVAANGGRAFLTARPQATERAVQRFKDWLSGHARELLAGAALLAGGYMVISGTLRLLS
jgi:hypothetical protein